MGYIPSEGDGEERDRFWKDMDRIVNRVGNGYRLCTMGDLNSWIGERVSTSKTGAFGVPERMIMAEECWSSVLKGDTVWVTNTLRTGVCISTQGWQGVKTEWRHRA